MNTDDLIAGLPGESLVRQGLADLRVGRHTIAATLLSMARPRLIRAGLLDDSQPPLPPQPELRLYRLLRAEGGDAYSRFNALVRELISFEQALDRRMGRISR